MCQYLHSIFFFVISHDDEICERCFGRVSGIRGSVGGFPCLVTSTPRYCSSDPAATDLMCGGQTHLYHEEYFHRDPGNARHRYSTYNTTG
ncbi:hypothetical protein B566_EDAN017658 [Ephemera danica]|nr:hypothetical protein B566_EDAN017658 [Ephemera danica]